MYGAWASAEIFLFPRGNVDILLIQIADDAVQMNVCKTLSRNSKPQRKCPVTSDGFTHRPWPRTPSNSYIWWLMLTKDLCSSTPGRDSKPPQERDMWCQLLEKWLKVSAIRERPVQRYSVSAIRERPTLLRGIWARSRRAGFRCFIWL